MDILDYDGSDQEEIGTEDVNEDDLLGGSDDEEVTKSAKPGSLSQGIDGHEPMQLHNDDSILEQNDEEEEYLDLNLGDEYDSLVSHSDQDFDTPNRVSPVKVRHVQQKPCNEASEESVSETTHVDNEAAVDGDDQENYEGGDMDKESSLGESFDADVDVGDDDQDGDEDEGKSRRARFHSERKPEDLPNNKVASEKPQQIRSLGDQRYVPQQFQRPRMWGSNVRANGMRQQFHRGFNHRGPRPRIPNHPQQRHMMMDAPIHQFNEPLIVDFNQPVRTRPQPPTAPVPPIRQEVGIVRPQPANPTAQQYLMNPRGARPMRPWKPPQQQQPNGPPYNQFPAARSPVPNTQPNPYPNGIGQPRPPMPHHENTALKPPQPIPLPETIQPISGSRMNQPRPQQFQRMRRPNPGQNFRTFHGGQFQPQHFPPNRPMQPFQPVPPFPNMDHSPGAYPRCPPPQPYQNQGPPQMWNGGDMHYQPPQFPQQTQQPFPGPPMYQQQQSPVPYMEPYHENYCHMQYSQHPFPGSPNYQPQHMNQNTSPVNYGNYEVSHHEQYHAMGEQQSAPHIAQAAHHNPQHNQLPQKRKAEDYIPLERGKDKRIPERLSRPPQHPKPTKEEELVNKIIIESKKEMGLDDNYMRQIEEQKRKREEILKQKAQKRRQEKDDGKPSANSEKRSSSKIYVNPAIIKPGDLSALSSNLTQANNTNSMSSSGPDTKPKKPKTILRVTKNKRGEIIHMEKLLKVEKN